MPTLRQLNPGKSGGTVQIVDSSGVVVDTFGTNNYNLGPAPSGKTRVSKGTYNNVTATTEASLYAVTATKTLYIESLVFSAGTTGAYKFGDGATATTDFSSGNIENNVITMNILANTPVTLSFPIPLKITNDVAVVNSTGGTVGIATHFTGWEE